MFWERGRERCCCGRELIILANEFAQLLDAPPFIPVWLLQSKRLSDDEPIRLNLAFKGYFLLGEARTWLNWTPTQLDKMVHAYSIDFNLNLFGGVGSQVVSLDNEYKPAPAGHSISNGVQCVLI